MASNHDAELDALLDKFVRVRLVQMGGVDLNVYQFDPLLSWSLFFMNGDKTIYGRFGTASPTRSAPTSNRRCRRDHRAETPSAGRDTIRACGTGRSHRHCCS